jgi:ATP-dependent Clp protease ATP-binding subunit ClpB
MYAPEFLNRIDETVVFNKLEDQHVTQVAKILLKQLKNNLRSNIKCRLIFNDNLVKHIVKLNDDTMYGARPLRRLITEHIETPLADLIIDHPGDVRTVQVTINPETDQIIFDVTHSI